MTTGQEFASVIQALREQFVRNFNAGNADELVKAFYSEDALLLPPNMPMVSGRSNIRDVIKAFLDMGARDASLKDIHVGSSGDLGYVIGTYSFNVGGARDSGKYLEVHRRQPDGSWKAIADIWNSDSPPPA